MAGIMGIGSMLTGCTGPRIQVSQMEDLRLTEDSAGGDRRAEAHGGKAAKEEATPGSGGSGDKSLAETFGPAESGKKAPGGQGADAEQGSDQASLAIYICGAVSRPGVYALPQGARIYQAIEAAGGFSREADTEWLNQAELVTDGEKITVPSRQETSELAAGRQTGGAVLSAQAGSAGGSISGPESGTPGQDTGSFGQAGDLVNLNTASKEELMTLPGIGEAKADSIIRYREENGAFASPEDLMQVSGIKNGLFSKISNRICV